MHDDKNNLSPSVNCPYFRKPQENGIDLIDILRFLVKQRFLIMAVTLCAILTAILYCFLIPPQYEAKAVVRELSPFDIMALNFYTSEENALIPKQIFSQMLDNLESKSLQDLFMENAKKTNLPETSHIDYLTSLKIIGQNIPRGPVEPLQAFISVQGKNPEDMAKMINTYIHFIHTYTLQKIIDSISQANVEEQKKLQGKIDLARKIAINLRQNRIAQLIEAREIATKLRIIKPIGESFYAVDEIPPYFRGAEALSVEITTLQQRQNDDPFIASLPELQEKLNQLSDLKIETENIKLVEIEDSVIPKNPFKPKKRLIISLGFIGGIVLGVFSAFIRNFQ
ncbi:MAG: Wzz/FepE/Etk N-terminal domain-containing protein [Thermodesulfobacteriota bacterium]